MKTDIVNLATLFDRESALSYNEFYPSSLNMVIMSGAKTTVDMVSINGQDYYCSDRMKEVFNRQNDILVLRMNMRDNHLCNNILNKIIRKVKIEKPDTILRYTMQFIIRKENSVFMLSIINHDEYCYIDLLLLEGGLKIES